ncbi:hypothetical protein [Nonomuraea sp. NPDC050786]|uniref:hypothetical protein n=1 Tax=Nonomuraea sp. NPDC050786 TaxID=3154840 RepID=UPI0033D5AD3E
MWDIAGSHHPQWLDAPARAHAVVEDRVRAEPDTMRYRLYHLPARLTTHARRHLRIDRTWPRAQAFALAWQRLTDLPALA